LNYFRGLAEVTVQIKTDGFYPNNTQMPFQIHNIDDLELSVSDSIIWLCFLLIICAIWFTLKKAVQMTELGRGS